MNLSKFLHLRLQGAALDSPVYNDMGKDDPPPPPDYRAAAQEQGQQNVYAAIASSLLNRPNEVSPYGSRTWNRTGSTNIGGGYTIPEYTSSINFTPEGKQLFDLDNQIKLRMGQLGSNSLGAVQSALAQPLDLTKNRDSLVDAMYRRQTRLLDPRFAQEQRQTETDLVNRGFSVGNEGYTRAMDDFSRRKEAAYGDAMDRATTTGAQQAIQEALLQRQQPLTELSSLRTGAAPSLPQFQNYWAGANVAAAPTFAATQALGDYNTDVYNAQVGSQNAMMSGLFGLGSAYMLGGGPGFSGGRR